MNALIISLHLLFAPIDSVNCDSLRWTCDSLVKAQQQEIGELRRMIARRDDEMLLAAKIEVLKDSMHVSFWHDLNFELAEQKRMSGEREKYFLIGWAIIAASSILVGHIIR